MNATLKQSNVKCIIIAQKDSKALISFTDPVTTLPVNAWVEKNVLDIEAEAKPETTTQEETPDLVQKVEEVKEAVKASTKKATKKAAKKK